jgi:ADP-heptose:LPS heptosyltransferase
MSFTRQPAANAARALARVLRSRRPAADEIAALASPARVHRILVIKIHDQLGDLLVATPALSALRERYPAALITLVVRAFLAPLARRIPDVDEVVVLPRVADPADALAFALAAGDVLTIRPELCVVLNSVSRSKTGDALAVLARPGVIVGRSVIGHGPLPDIASATTDRDPVYDVDAGIQPASDHQTERLLDLVRWTGADADATRLRLVVREAGQVAGRERLESAWRASLGSKIAGQAPGRVRWIGIHPGAANPEKCWPLEHFVALGLAIVRGAAPGEERRLVVFDAPRERGRATAVHAGLLVGGADAAFIPAGPLDGFIECAPSLDLLMCNDSGVMHIAAAVGVPTVSFHALGRPAEWAPRNAASTAFYEDRAIASIPVEPAIAAAERALEIRARDRGARSGA